MPCARHLAQCAWLPLVACACAASSPSHPYLAFCLAAPLAHLLFVALVHRLSPYRSAMRPRLQPHAAGGPYYHDDDVADAARGFARAFRTVAVAAADAPDCVPKAFTVVHPARARSNKCVLWVSGYGRYFSHTNAAGDLADRAGGPVDLLGLDLPHYGRTYHAQGIDRADNPFNALPPSAGRHRRRRNDDDGGDGENGSSAGIVADKWCAYYYACYADALALVADELGYEEIYVMCNSTSGLTFQCFLEDGPRDAVSRVAGVIYTAPFWHPSARSQIIVQVPEWVWEVVARCFPRLVVDQDTGDGALWLEEHLETAHRDGREGVRIDPRNNPTDHAPYFIEWFAMVAEAQGYIRRLCAAGPSRLASPRRLARMPRALLLTVDGEDKNVSVPEVHRMFHLLYNAGPEPRGEAHRVRDLNHEAMLSKCGPYAEALARIRRFIR